MRAYAATLATALGLCAVVVVLGAYVRLSDAGLGCPDWPGCYGLLTVPQDADAIAHAERAFPERPVEVAKAWKEMVHRYAASLLGLLIVGMALLARRAGASVGAHVGLVALVVFQGILGMWTVTWQLKPLAVTAHLLGGFATFGLLWWLWLSHRARVAAPAMREPRNEREAMAQLAAPDPAGWPAGLRAAALAGLLLVAGQVFLGGWTSSNYAALACPDLPTCQGAWWPELDLGEAFTLWRGLGVNYEFGVLDNRARVTIHHLHRVGALVVSAWLVLLGAMLWRRGLRGHAGVLWGALGAQVAIGLSIVHWQLPLALATAHNGGAAVLWLAVIAVNHRLARPAP